MCTAILWIVLGLFYGVSFGDIVAISVILILAAYLLGDLFALPLFGNTVATIADFGLTFFGVWLLGIALIEHAIPIVTASLISAIAVAIGEMFFHRYVKNEVLHGRRGKDRLADDDNLATEFAEENNVRDIRQNDDTNRK